MMDAVPDSGAEVRAQKGKSVPWWFWAAVMLPVLAAAGGVWFLTRTEAGRLLWLDYQYRNLGVPERLPVSSQPSWEGPPGHPVVIVRIRRDGQYLLGDDLVGLDRLGTECRMLAVASVDADGRSTSTVGIIADRRCRASHVVRVIEAARRAGIRRFTLVAMSSQPPSQGKRRSPVRIFVQYPDGPDSVEEILPGPEWSVQDLVRELDRAWSAGVNNYCIGKYKLD